MRMYGRLALHAESVTLPLLAPDAPVVTWWHGAAARADRLRPARRVRRPADHRRRAGPPTGWRRCARGPRTTPPATPTWPGPGSPAGARRSPARSTARPNARRARVVDGDPTDPSALLLAGWLSAKFGFIVPVNPTSSHDLERVTVDVPERRTRCGRPTTPAGCCCSATASPTRSRRSRSARPASCWPRSCAASTPTTPTPRRSARSPASPGSATGRASGCTSGRTPRSPTDDRLSRSAMAQPSPNWSSPPSAEQLSDDVAGRLVATLVAAQAVRPLAFLAVTGRRHPRAGHARRWRGCRSATRSTGRGSACGGPTSGSSPADSADRNDRPAFAALFDQVALDPANIHRMPAVGRRVRRRRRRGRGRAMRPSWPPRCPARQGRDDDIPRFDVDPARRRARRALRLAVPRAAGHRTSSTRRWSRCTTRPSRRRPGSRSRFRALDSANEVWFIAAGTGKAHAVALACSGADRVQVPSAGPRGHYRTLWLIDRDAAAASCRPTMLPTAGRLTRLGGPAGRRLRPRRGGRAA